MCLIVKDGCKVERAKNDIKVYKFINKHRNYWNPWYHQESVRFNYCKPIKALGVDLHPIKNLTIYHFRHIDAIYEGFHSRVNSSVYQTNTICIIPKGSEICYGTHEDIVSNQIIVFKNYFQYLIYKLKKYFRHE